ncbi:uncharacterized protein LOC131941168 [Physella acuta]|uniref:uncharacterized protein LOC131941168 n=1 Tax=Physella acuta TaxID=109671 RepID=UPI0027DB928D|nr:uncharacterized protein LOC131941168 [Physella acuta]
MDDIDLVCLPLTLRESAGDDIIEDDDELISCNTTMSTIPANYNIKYFDHRFKEERIYSLQILNKHNLDWKILQKKIMFAERGYFYDEFLPNYLTLFCCGGMIKIKDLKSNYERKQLATNNRQNLNHHYSGCLFYELCANKNQLCEATFPVRMCGLCQVSEASFYTGCCKKTMFACGHCLWEELMSKFDININKVCRAMDDFPRHQKVESCNLKAIGNLLCPFCSKTFLYSRVN